MEGIPLTALWPILRRRWWIVLGLPLLTALLTVLLTKPAPSSYRVDLAFAINVPESSLLPGSDEGTRAKVAEAIVDDLARIIGRDVFAEAVANRLPADLARSRAPKDLVGMISSSLSADDRHRIIEIAVTGTAPPAASPEAEAALASDLDHIARAVIEELEQQPEPWLSALGEDHVELTLIDRPDPAHRLPPSLRQRLDLPLRVIAATLLALALATLLHLRDPRLHDPAAAAQAAGAPILARIPRR